MKVIKKIIVILLVSVSIALLNSCFIAANAHKNNNPNINHPDSDDDGDEYDGFINFPLNNGVSTVSVNQTDTIVFASR